MIRFIIILLMFAMLYFDNIASVVFGSSDNRGPFQAVFIIFIGFMLFISIYECIKHNRIYISNIFKSVTLISVIFLLGNFIIGPSGYYGTLRCMYSFAWMVLIFSMDNIFMYMNEKQVRNFTLLMACVFLYSVFNAIQAFFLMSALYDRTLIPSIYITVMFIPWILSIKYRIFGKFDVKLLLMFIMIIITIFSIKRGAILAVFAAIMVFYYKNTILNKGRASIIKIVLCTIPFLLALVVIDSYLGGSILSRFSTAEIQDGSGRAESNAFALNLFFNPPTFFEFIFGFSDQSLTKGGEFIGHNDWLVFAMKNGLVGLLCFMSFFYILYKNAFHSKDPSISPSYCVLFIVMLLQSLYSTSYNPTIHPIMAMMYIGFAEAQIRKHKINS